MNRLLQECGFELAAKSSNYATLICAAIGVRNIFAGSRAWPVFLLYGCSSIVGVTIAAKFTARAIARVRLRRIIAELREFEMPAIPSTTMTSR